MPDAKPSMSIFNLKASEKLRNPDDLDKYIRVTKPSVWELFVNVANYAYGESSGKVRVAYTFIPEPCGIKVDIIDEGIPFDPLEKDDPDLPSNASDLQIGGLGIFMTKNMADSISYEYRDGQNITTFVLHW